MTPKDDTNKKRAKNEKKSTAQKRSAKKRRSASAVPARKSKRAAAASPKDTAPRKKDDTAPSHQSKGRTRRREGIVSSAADAEKPSSSLRWHHAPSIPQSIRATFDEGIAYAQWMVDRAHEHPETSVHEYRKTVRRLRALIRLLRGILGPIAFRSLDTGLRSAVTPTSGLRDARILLAALEQVPTAPGTKKLRKALRDEWTARREELENGDEEARVLAASRLPLARLPGELAADLPTVITQKDLQRATRESYRRARQAFQKAVRRGEDTQIHTARKRAKELRYQLEWLVEVSSGRIQKRWKRFARFAQELGNVTDLLVLEHAVEVHARDLRGLHPKRFARRLHELALEQFQELVDKEGDPFEEPSGKFVRGVAKGAAAGQA